MAFTRLGSKVSLGVLGWGICLTVIHGYFFSNRPIWPSKSFFSRPAHRSHRVRVTGVLSIDEDGADEDELLLLPQPAASTAAPASTSAASALRALAGGRDDSRLACMVIQRSPFDPDPDF